MKMPQYPGVRPNFDNHKLFILSYPLLSLSWHDTTTLLPITKDIFSHNTYIKHLQQTLVRIPTSPSHDLLQVFESGATLLNLEVKPARTRKQMARPISTALQLPHIPMFRDK